MRFVSEEEQNHILNLVKQHLGSEDKATAVTEASGTGPADAEMDEVDDDTYAELQDMEGLIDEGTGHGAMEDEAKDIDEVDA